MRRPRLTTDYNITPNFGQHEPSIAKEWFADWPEGNGIVALYEPAATWFENMLKSARRPHEKRMMVWPDPSAMHVLGNLTKHTRDCHKNKPVAVFKVGLVQSACDEIMTILNNFPCDGWYEMDLVNAVANHPSHLIAELRDTHNIESIGYIAAHQYAKDALRDAFDEAGIKYTYRSRHKLNLDDEATAERLLRNYVKESELTRLIYQRGSIDLIEVHKPQAICDRITAATVCDPFLPEILIRHRHDKITPSEQARQELEYLDDEILPLRPDADKPLPAYIQLHIDEWLKELFDAHETMDQHDTAVQ